MFYGTIAPMEKALLKKIEKNYSRYKDELLDVVTKYNYRYNRYNHSYSLVLFASTATIMQDFLLDLVRQTDRIVVFDKEFFGIVFDSVDEKAGLKASENILVNLEPAVFGKKIFVSVLNATEASDEDALVRKSLEVLINEIKLGVDDIPMSQ